MRDFVLLMWITMGRATLSMFYYKFPDNVITTLNSMSASARKNIVVAIVVVLKGLNKNVSAYEKILRDTAKTIDDHYKSQKKTSKQQKKWVDADKLKKLVNRYYDENIKRLFRKTKITGCEMMKIQDYVIAQLLCTCKSGMTLRVWKLQKQRTPCLQNIIILF